jgi:ectoine hydroxylase-related dioxygenase (phytanoyl-CoA dioxygenase family)
MSPTEQLRPITDDEVAAFWRDGVVCLRGVMPAAWLESMAAPVDAALAGSAVTDLSSMGDDLERHAGAVLLVDEHVRDAPIPRGHFKAGTDHWCEQPEFLAFATRSPLGPIVARLLGSAQVRLYEDSVLVKEPGTQEKTAFHQDMAYFHLAGELVCTTWVPLDPVRAESGAVRFVVGSHRDRTRYKPNMFVTTMTLPDTIGAEVPDYDQTLHVDHVDAARIVSFDTEPGDITVHHARAIHGAYANASATQRRRAISVRYAGDDTTFVPVAGGFAKPHHAHLHPGDALDSRACPLAWPRD